MWVESVTIVLALIAAMGVVAAVLPKLFLDQLVALDLPSSIWVLVAIRIVFGVALWLVAPESDHPTLFRAVGALAVAAGLLLPVVGGDRIARILGWWLAQPLSVMRAGGVLLMGFALFMLWSLHAA